MPMGSAARQLRQVRSVQKRPGLLVESTLGRTTIVASSLYGSASTSECSSAIGLSSVRSSRPPNANWFAMRFIAETAEPSPAIRGRLCVARVTFQLGGLRQRKDLPTHL